MDFDIMLLITLGSIGAFIVGIALGYFLDLHKRAKMLRQLTKKDYGLLCLVSKDGHTIKKMLINFQHDCIRMGTEIWVCEKKRIYREDMPEKQAFAEETNLRWVEGVPCLYVDKDSLRPLDFYREQSDVKPAEVGAILLSWINNQLAKGYATLSNLQKFIWVIIILVILVGGIAYFGYAEAQNAKNEAINAKVEIQTLRGQLIDAGVIHAPTPVMNTTNLTSPTPTR